MNSRKHPIDFGNLSRRNFLTLSLLGIATLASPAVAGLAPKTAHASPSPHDEYGENQITERLNTIANSYAVGEALSPEDADFVRAHAISTTAPATRGSQSISGSGGAQGTYVSVSGSAYHSGFASYTWGFDALVKTTKGTTPSYMLFVADLTTYGSSNGQLIMKGTDSQSHSVYNVRSFTANKSKSNNGFTAFYTIACRCEVHLPNGSVFTIA